MAEYKYFQNSSEKSVEGKMWISRDDWLSTHVSSFQDNGNILLLLTYSRKGKSSIPFLVPVV